MDKQEAVKEFMLAAGQHVPEGTNIPDPETRILRAKLILEEAFEFAKASGVQVFANYQLGGTRELLRLYDADDLLLEDNGMPDYIDVADATADLKYVVYGADVAYGIPGDKVFEEVHKSNMSKFIDGHKRKDGKWVKGPSYKPANISEVLAAERATKNGS